MWNKSLATVHKHSGCDYMVIYRLSFYLDREAACVRPESGSWSQIQSTRAPVRGPLQIPLFYASCWVEHVSKQTTLLPPLCPFLRDVTLSRVL
jgi:hypothetical protein